jgi:hypothetical protein
VHLLPADAAVEIVSIANPENLGIMGSMGDSCGYVWGIAGGSSIVGVASLSGLAIFTVPCAVCDTASFRPLSRFSPYRWIKPPADSLVPCDSCWAPAQWIKTDDVVFDDNFAYLLYYDNYFSNSYLCLKKVDLIDPANPRCVDSLELHSFGCALAVSDGYAYVVHNIPLIGQWNVMPEMDIIDVRTEPMTPKGSIRLPGRGEDIVVTEKQAYISCSAAGVSVVDVSDPQRPVQVDSFPFAIMDSSNPLIAKGIAPGDSSVYVAAGEGGLLILKNSTTAVRERPFPDRRGGPVFKTEFRSGSVTLRFCSGFSGTVSMSLYNVKGEVVLQQPFLFVQKGTVTVRCVNRLNRPLPPGMYFLRVKAGSSTDAYNKVLIR